MPQLDNGIESEKVVAQERALNKALKKLIERIKLGQCVLVLGPRVAIRPDDPERTPLDELG